MRADVQRVLHWIRNWILADWSLGYQGDLRRIRQPWPNWFWWCTSAIENRLKFARHCAFDRTFLYRIFDPKRKACDVIHLECLYILTTATCLQSSVLSKWVVAERLLDIEFDKSGNSVLEVVIRIAHTWMMILQTILHRLPFPQRIHGTDWPVKWLRVSVTQFQCGWPCPWAWLLSCLVHSNANT